MSDPLTIGIVDYQAGNLRNVQKAIEAIGFAARITRTPDELEHVDGLVLPGVGSFNAGMKNLNASGFDIALRRYALEDNRPILGICLGMQLFANSGDEGGEIDGLGLIPGRVVRLDVGEFGLRSPHVGWNSVTPIGHGHMFAGIPPQADFYFVHGYHVAVEQSSIVSGSCEYGIEINAAVEKDNVWATQFHPEKSQRYGITVLKNFTDYVGKSK